ncbi:sn-glycerol-3-phosphate ABC transporter ATP-binding protein UgpC [Aerococcus sp. CDC-944-U94]|uniref:ABC transporter ATP-binding protein n=1 Tax=Aerococcus urinae (strain CCUG 59500 / ACS-120-V-Col10a) TaxID=2976812 RepID=UPI00227BD0E1|nr:sn-glycerol-3-phosphate ABC transporter ATP-binding protein UgpC [Aerococcus sp. Group 1]MCY3054231.1 sn-glycerol-3-phosphate ABC transporter ATP-binding protein UgpC [Aerococcus sp. Group 1]MCY3055961.1 sn-glycerol-3-phosphate ABC transporter ATP-binding protein UgpC [Aerococcus sp. Group 1]
MSTIELKNVSKRYPGNENYSVKNFNLDVGDGEFIVFVGPSGCGKSTTLRMIAGLEEISQGDLLIDGEVVNDKDPKDRNIAMVFQNYALFPHLSVADNIGFGLKIRKVDKDKREQAVKDAAELVGLSDYLDKKPGALSGGQMQRVALARAIVKSAGILLMDEPLSNLDAKLRVQMRSEIVNLQKHLHATTVYVTHDQAEAMTMADRIVVMNQGQIQQIGAPWEVYNNPKNLFVATFLGTPPMNTIQAYVKDGKVLSRTDRVLVDHLPGDFTEGQEIVVGFRPEKAQVTDNPDQAHFTGSIQMVELLGADYDLHVKLEISQVIVKEATDKRYEAGQEIAFNLDSKDLYYFDKKSGERLVTEND